MNEIKMRKDYRDLGERTISDIERVIENGEIYSPKNKAKLKDILQKMDFNSANAIGEFTASIFGVDRADLLSSDRTMEVTYARWMYWYALYFMCRKSYRMIAILTSLETNGHKPDAICSGITKLQTEMKVNNSLQQKWDVIKKMIYIGRHPDAYDNPFSDPMPIQHVKVIKPKNVEIEIVEK